MYLGWHIGALDYLYCIKVGILVHWTTCNCIKVGILVHWTTCSCIKVGILVHWTTCNCIKVGQHIGALDYLLPEEYVETMNAMH